MEISSKLKTLFLPMLCLQYQHGAGWAGAFVPSPISISLTLLGIQKMEREGERGRRD
jgi:hypothetical protein